MLAIGCPHGDGGEPGRVVCLHLHEARSAVYVFILYTGGRHFYTWNEITSFLAPHLIKRHHLASLRVMHFLPPEGDAITVRNSGRSPS